MEEVPMLKDVKAGLVPDWKLCIKCMATGTELYFDPEDQLMKKQICTTCNGQRVKKFSQTEGRQPNHQ